MGCASPNSAVSDGRTSTSPTAASGFSVSKGACPPSNRSRPRNCGTLKRYLKQRGNVQLPWLFLNERGDQFTRSAINYLVGITGVRAGLTFHVHPHMLRHGCGYALANRGYDLRLIQDYLGHRDPKHTTRYTRTAAHRFEGLWE